jgi:NAD(P)-dependent dehydrogenase (short-subunit alcohol dehydrogenase family)
MVRERPVALVTGGASGIGRATACLLAAEGWRVGLIDWEAAALERAAAEIGTPAAAVADVAREAEVEPAVAALTDRLGGLDGVVNAAGIAVLQPALETDAATFLRILDINVVGSFLVARAAARLMRGRGGAIVNIASVSGLRGNVDRLAYGASKAAVVQMTRIMAVEWAEHGIRVNAVAPGPVETPMAAAVHHEAGRRLWIEATPMHRYAEPEEIATAIAFLLDPKRSGYVTGLCLPVDGGFSASGLHQPPPSPGVG